jgi:hypothetical protein
VRRERSGQATVEYILLLAMVVSLYAAFLRALSEKDVFKKLQAPITNEFAKTYRYGHPKAKGMDDGGPVNIPTVQSKGYDEQNFRIFYNPSIE